MENNDFTFAEHSRYFYTIRKNCFNYRINRQANIRCEKLNSVRLSNLSRKFRASWTGTVLYEN